ncbi:MAG TPA: sigma-54 dependent transcriptional regulator [Gemmatimonadota bacterium]|nr:sigma-54 dependent transcriptional regulator [Gemmatimonadota bacterium]
MAHGLVLVSRYDPEYAVRVERTLAAAGVDVHTVDSLREARDRVLESSRPVLVVLSGGLEEPTTRTFLRAIEDASAPAAVLALIDRRDPGALERYRRWGIDEFLEKPFDPDELLLVARRLVAREELVGRTRIIGRSNAMKEVLERVAQYAPVHSTVLIEGESGTGKELVARAIHDLSPRGSKPFIAINCAALTETLLESELFGHEKGSFTGATGLRKGRFEIADRGTLFLDEVGEMPRATQVKLLRVLEEKEFMRVGGSTSLKVDVRVIAATNKELAAAVEAGEFRRDLYYRLHVLHVRIPPLRERREDIPLLVHHFVQELCRENDSEFVGITDEAMEILTNYDWLGNVRELRNLVESMLVLTPGGKIRPRDIPPEIYRRAGPERLLPVALPEEEGEGGPSARRIEVLLGYFYRDLKDELDELRRENAEILARIAEGGREVDWLHEYEVEGEPGEEPRHVALVPVGPRAEAAPPESESRESLESAHSPAASDGESPFRVGASLQEMERAAIQRTLEAVGGNRRKAAEILGIGERTLYRKIKQFELP